MSDMAAAERQLFLAFQADSLHKRRFPVRQEQYLNLDPIHTEVKALDFRREPTVGQ